MGDIGYLVSDCCGAPSHGYEEYGICSDCREHTDYILEEVEDMKELEGLTVCCEAPTANNLGDGEQIICGMCLNVTEVYEEIKLP